MTLTVIGGSWQKARKPHTCWLCGRIIEKGEGYYKTVGLAHGKFYSVKHCRTTCEIVPEILEQNPDLESQVLEPTYGA